MKICATGSFSCKSNSFSYERFSTRPRFETEAQGNTVKKPITCRSREVYAINSGNFFQVGNPGLPGRKGLAVSINKVKSMGSLTQSESQNWFNEMQMTKVYARFNEMQVMNRH